MSNYQRFVFSFAIALASGIINYGFNHAATVQYDMPIAYDLSWPLSSAKLLLEGHDPYTFQIPHVPAVFKDDPLYYPLPAVLLVIPLSFLYYPLAGAVFMFLSGFMLAWLLLRQGTKYLALFASPAYVVCCLNGQWTALMIGASMIPVLSWITICKPTTGLILFLRSPNRIGVIIGAVIVLASIVAYPMWLSGWIHNLSLAHHFGPMTILPFGPLLLLSLLRRDTAGYTMLGMAVIPQMPWYYDSLPLWLVPDTARGKWILTGLGWVGYLFIEAITGKDMLWQVHIVFIYLPCLVILLWDKMCNDAQYETERMMVSYR